MSTSTVSRTWRIGPEHFQPDAAIDHKEQRQIHGKLEKIDYIAYKANRATLGARLVSVTESKFEKLATAAAEARFQWISTALNFADENAVLSEEQIKTLTSLRVTYDELTEAYSALRRMVERSYVHF